MDKQIRFHATGGPDVLQLEDLAVGEPGPGQARVRHSAIGVNFIDAYYRSGLYALPTLPHVIGGESVGLIGQAAMAESADQTANCRQ